MFIAPVLHSRQRASAGLLGFLLEVDRSSGHRRWQGTPGNEEDRTKLEGRNKSEMQRPPPGTF